MELVRLDIGEKEGSEVHAPSRISFNVASTSGNASKNDGDEVQKSGAVEENINTYTLGRGPLLQITDTRISR